MQSETHIWTTTEFKKDAKNYRDAVQIVRPVIEKMSTIVDRHIRGYDVSDIFLVGGTTCLPEFEDIHRRADRCTYP